MRPAALVATVFGTCVLALVATAPASLLDAGLQRNSDGRLRLVEARGSVWSGAGRIEARTTGSPVDAAGDLSWQVRPWSFLRGRVAFDVAIGQSGAPFTLAFLPAAIIIENADVSIPAALLALGVPQLATLQPLGRVRIRVQKLSIARQRLTGGALLQWRDAGSGLTAVKPLGDYEIVVTGRGREVGSTLRTLAGPLHLAGTGTWEQADGLVLRVTAVVAAPYRAQLVPLLRLIAVEGDGGQFELQLGAAY